ncbi:MAG: NifU family protein [Bdellovibrionaceae bacterium]|nr:NifU family protein [Pseudobdellovibrionaceae bacterium]MBX3033373.1 NifU family protein [Pseudobdellovibrionaceae bacterium]
MKQAVNPSAPVSFEATPNPATLKFLLFRPVASDPFDCPTPMEAERSPLASKIFGFPWTASVYVGTDFITVTKHDWVDWSVLAQPLAGLIQEHLDNGEPLVVDAPARGSNEASPDDSPVVRQIKDILNREIRPVVALDGGDITFAKYENHVVFLHMKGACSGCPSSSATLKDGIEVRLKEAIPEIIEVVSV